MENKSHVPNHQPACVDVANNQATGRAGDGS